jgi:replication-associated recombination protein RarA
MDKLLLSERETMDALGIGRTLLRRMMAEERISATHIGRRIVFHVDEVRRFADTLQLVRRMP